MVKNIRRKTIALFCLLLLLAGILLGCVQKTSQSITSLKQLAAPGTKIGTGSDLLEWEMLQKDYPQAKVLAYSENTLGFRDVADGRIDAYVYPRREMELAILSGLSGVRVLEESYNTDRISVGISPVSDIPDLEQKINAFLAELRANGTLDDMYDRWVVRFNQTMPEIPAPENPSLHLRVGTTGTVVPYSYYVGTQLNGYDIELAYRFAAWLNADLEFKMYDFSGIIAAAQTGDVDCIMSDLIYTPEKAESISFSDQLFEIEIGVLVRDTGAAAPVQQTVRAADYNGKRLGVSAFASA